MKLTVPIFDETGTETGLEVIEVTELADCGEWTMSYEDGGYLRKFTEIKLSEIKHAHMDDVIATLDNYYGYFKYQIQ